MMAEPGCCQGCVPANRLAVVEILADHPLKLGTGQVRVAGNWQISSDPDGWRSQLQGAEVKPGSSAGAGPSDQASSRTIHPLSVRKCIKVCDRARR
jgi:membrane dipeptidase